MSSGLKVASIPPATSVDVGDTFRVRWASARSWRRVMPVVENPTMLDPRSPRIWVSSRSGGPSQQFGSKTRAGVPASWSTPASRHTPRGGERNVYSPQLGS